MRHQNDAIDVALVSLLWTLSIFFTPCSSVSIVNFENVIAVWIGFLISLNKISQSEDSN